MPWPCRAESIEFCSLTPPLQQRMLAGEQVYFTYDQHWTPLGHRVVADAVAKLLADKPAAETAPTTLLDQQKTAGRTAPR